MTDRRDFWETSWRKEDLHGFWSQADPEVASLLESLPAGTQRDVLDLGCGIGRHALLFSRAGHRVTAVDMSETALDHVRSLASKLGLRIEARQARFHENVFGPETFDVVLAVNVLYHGLPLELTQATAHIRNWLRPEGLLYFTCPTLKDGEYGRGTRLAPHTFEFEPGHIHCNAAWEDLTSLLDGFSVVSRKVRDHQWRKDGVIRSSSRWQVLARKEL